MLLLCYRNFKLAPVMEKTLSSSRNSPVYEDIEEVQASRSTKTCSRPRSPLDARSVAADYVLSQCPAYGTPGKVIN